MSPSACLLLATWIAVCVLVALPAIAAHRWLVRRGETDERVLLAGPLVASGLVAYAAFFAYFLHPLAGKIFSIAVLAGVAVYVIRGRDGVPALAAPSSSPWRTLAGLIFSVGLFYLALLFLPVLHREPEWQSQVRFLYEFPIDANLPKMLGDRLYAGESPKPFLPDLGWLSSDRPPLQVGLYLLVRPWLALFNVPAGLAYQCAGTLAQLLCLPGIWLLARLLGFERRAALILTLLCTTSGLLLFNATYVWPKLLAGGYVLIAAVLLLDRTRPRRALVDFCAGATAALGWLGHGAVAFSLSILAVVLLVPRWFPGWRSALTAALAFGLLALPWTAYQKFYDPPANRLMKWHLAGVVEIDPRTTWEAIRDVYTQTPTDVVLANKRINLRFLQVGSWSGAFDFFTTSLQERRVDEFFHVFRSLGCLNLAWLLAPVTWLARRRWPPHLAEHSALFAWTFGTMIFWALTLFIPNATIVHSSSYAMMLGLFVLALAWLMELPRWLGWPVIAWYVAGFALTWLPYSRSASLDAAMFVLLALAAALVAWLFRRGDDPWTPLVEAVRRFAQATRSQFTVAEGRYPLKAALLTATAVLVVLFLRRPEAFLRPQFWAEDGSVFYLQAEYLGPASLAQTYGGYHLLLLRLFAAAASGLDPLWIPAAYFWSSVAITLAVVFAIFSPRLDLPRKPWLALAIVLLPHSGEALHNLTNAQWVAALGLVILLLLRDPERGSQWITDLMAAAVIGLTGVFSVLFAPLFLVRAWLRRTPAAWTLAAVAAVAAAVQLVALIQGAPRAAIGPSSGPIEVLRMFAERTAVSLFLPSALADSPAFLLAVVGAILLGTLAWVAFRPDELRTTRLMLWGCFAAIVASLVVKFRTELVVLSDNHNADRYFFLPKVMILWLLILEWDTAAPWRRVARAAGVLALIAGLSAFRFEPYVDYDWPSWAARIRAGEEVRVPINPPISTFWHPGRPAPAPAVPPPRQNSAGKP